MIIGGRRVCGKTSTLINKAHEKQLYIICADRDRVRALMQQSRHMKLDIPFPVTVNELPLRSSYITEVLVDDIESVMFRLVNKPISIMSTSREMKEM